jgi:hypothetical protein
VGTKFGARALAGSATESPGSGGRARCHWHRPRQWCRLTISRWYGQRFSASQCGATCRPRACLSVPRSLSPRAFTSCGARPCAAARRSLRHSERSPTWRVAKSSADRDASLTLRWREMDSNPRSPVRWATVTRLPLVPLRPVSIPGRTHPFATGARRRVDSNSKDRQAHQDLYQAIVGQRYISATIAVALVRPKI